MRSERSDNGVRIEFKVHFERGRCGHRRLCRGESASTRLEPGNVPRISRLLALAHHLDGLVKSGEVKDYAEAARLGHVTPARLTQIMNLLLLAPDIQEEILLLPRTTKGRDPVCERNIRRVVAEPTWTEQRNVWQALAPNRAARPEG